MVSPAPSSTPAQPGGGGWGTVSSALLTAIQNIVTAINGLASTLTAARVQARGSFTLGAAATTSVVQIAVASGSTIMWAPLNASAATLEGSAKALYLSSQTAGTGFVVATASGGNAAGTEVFSYVVLNG